MCFAPQPRAIFEHRNFQNGSANVVFWAFWLANVLRATAACHFWTSELPKWLRECGVFNILTWKCASRHSCVPFLNIGTSKMAPRMWCFEHFDLQMCFAPQPRAIFEHRNFQNGSANVVFWAFWLANVLRATAACHFWTSEVQKVLRHRQFFLAFSLPNVLFATAACHFWPVCWTATSAPAALARLLFGTSGTTNHWENTAIRDVPNIFRACTFFLLNLHACGSPFCWLDISTLLDTSTLLFNPAYCRKLDF